MGNDFMGKTNKELIIELIGRVEVIQDQLQECRPTCFRNDREVISLKQEIKSFKWFLAIVASFTTVAFNIGVWIWKKLNGG